MTKTLIAGIVALCTHATLAADISGGVPSYTEEALAAGINHTYDGPWENFVGGGVATFDCNGDRFPEVFVAGGVNESALYINKSSAGGGFKFMQDKSTVTRLKQVVGAYPVNVDNDHWMDLVVLRLGENYLLRGLGDCQFSVANTSIGFDGGAEWSTGFSAAFFNDDAYPTLAVGNYIDRDAPGSPWGTCSDNMLYRPQLDDDGQVSYDGVLPLSPGHCSLSLLFTDWNQSGEDSLRITNDRQYYRGGEEQLWKINASAPSLYGRADGWQSLVIWGMGIAEADLNADGFPEYALTSMGDTKLQSIDVQQATQENHPVYEDVGYARGATAHRPYTGEDLNPSTGWHAQFADVNHDTFLDLYIAKGNVEKMKEFAAYDPDNLLLGTSDGQFIEHGDKAGIALDRRGRGAAIEDLNADGLLDLLVVNRSSPVSLFRHTGFKTESNKPPGANWLAVELNQIGGNRHAVGAHLSIETGDGVQTRRVQVGGGHASGQSGFMHIGLGAAENATVRVQWPDGELSDPFGVVANRFAVITRGSEQVGYWYPPSR